uniref:DUF1767 domain-containing protein n=1 Tax=Caenorhabditis japonica TaxID=281687 RepID=A0A8R1ECD9_CAEJA
MSSRCTYLMQYFSDRYVLIKDDWLSTVIDFLYEKVPESRRFPDEKFSNLVFDQWAWADFSTTSFPAFANHGINEQATKQELQSPIVCQVSSLLISTNIRIMCG